jgi:ribonuclease III
MRIAFSVVAGSPAAWISVVKKLEKKLGYAFQNRALLEEALRHSSYGYERELSHNERLEFLGDSILNACTTTLLVDHFSDLREGQLSHLRSRLVNTTTLAEIGRSLGLDDALQLGKGIAAKGGKRLDSVLADTTEAVLGAVYLDGGFEVARELTRGWMTPRMAVLEVSDERQSGWLDPRGLLQHHVQKRHGEPPAYVVTGTSGPDHEPLFTVEARIHGQILGTGRGRNKRSASRAAAVDALSESDAGGEE